MSDLEDIGVDQTRRLISVESFAPGKKKILVSSFEGREELSTLSTFRLEIISLGRPLKPSEMLGQKLTVALRVREKARYFNGVIRRFEAISTSIRGHYLHAAELVPPAWLLTLQQRCQIFQDQKATDIVGQLLHDADISSQVKSVGASREYTVQYCESDFNFMTRLLEDEGLFFRFAHEDASCPIIIGDGTADYTRLDPESLEYETDVSFWQPQYRVGSSAFQHADWDFKAVSVVDGSANGLAKVQPPGMPARPFYEYPGGFEDTSEGRRLARARMEEQEVPLVWILGESNHVALCTGAKFKLKDHSVALPASNATADSYVLTRVDHSAHDFSDMPYEGKTEYTNKFTCIPAELAFRPARSTPRPRIRGPQTATVTDGPDEFGRAKVKFPWAPDDSSGWARVAQSWAYNQMGTQFLPRIDSEVVVEFLDGDPDHPIIVGMVYNGKNKLPYSTPANKTQSGIRGANWDDAGVADKSNELRFEDRSGAEEIFMHAQKDFRRVVKNDDALTIEQGNRTVQVKMGDVSEKLDMGNYSAKLSLGNHEVKLDAGASKVEALQSITLKVGNNSLTIDQTGVQIKGLMVKIEGQVMLDVKAPMTMVNGDGMLTLKGGITMVN